MKALKYQDSNTNKALISNIEIRNKSKYPNYKYSKISMYLHPQASLQFASLNLRLLRRYDSSQRKLGSDLRLDTDFHRYGMNNNNFPLSHKR
jgi:hypothetical protein